MDADRLDAVALITGAGSGLGAAIARDIARRSDGGLILVDANEEAISAVADDLEKRSVAPERLSTLAFDVSDEERWRQAVSFIRGQYGRLDWAIVTAGAPKPAEESDLVSWGNTPSADLESAMLSLRAIVPLMRGTFRGGGIVVSAPAHTIEKTDATPGLLRLMRVAAKEGGPDRIRVNAVAHGSTATPIVSSAPWFRDLIEAHGSDRAAFEHLAGMVTPLARYARADDIAKLITMLLSDDTEITGATLVVDGGYTL